MRKIPKDFPVRPLTRAKFEGRTKGKAKSPCKCPSCHRMWDDGIPTSITPTPAGRCPFEYFHS